MTNISQHQSTSVDVGDRSIETTLISPFQDFQETQAGNIFQKGMEHDYFVEWRCTKTHYLGDSLSFNYKGPMLNRKGNDMIDMIRRMFGRRLDWDLSVQAGREIAPCNADPGFAGAFEGFYVSPQGEKPRRYAETRGVWIKQPELVDGRKDVAVFVDAFNSGIISAADKRCSREQADVIITQLLYMYERLFLRLTACYRSVVYCASPPAAYWGIVDAPSRYDDLVERVCGIARQLGVIVIGLKPFCDRIKRYRAPNRGELGPSTTTWHYGSNPQLNDPTLFLEWEAWLHTCYDMAVFCHPCAQMDRAASYYEPPPMQTLRRKFASPTLIPASMSTATAVTAVLPMKTMVPMVHQTVELIDASPQCFIPVEDVEIDCVRSTRRIALDCTGMANGARCGLQVNSS